MDVSMTNSGVASVVDSGAGSSAGGHVTNNTGNDESRVGATVVPTTVAPQTATVVRPASNTAIIVRGLPGSGKSTLTQSYVNYAKATWPDATTPAVVCSADDFFVHQGRYQFNPRLLNKAHHECLSKFVDALEARVPAVIVDNTNSTAWEYRNYVKIAKLAGYTVKVVEIACDRPEIAIAMNARNRHRVPPRVSLSMYDRWEEDTTSQKLQPVGLDAALRAASNTSSSTRRDVRYDIVAPVDTGGRRVPPMKRKSCYPSSRSNNRRGRSSRPSNAIQGSMQDAHTKRQRNKRRDGDDAMHSVVRSGSRSRRKETAGGMPAGDAA